MRVLAVVLGKEAVEVALDLLGFDVPSLLPLDAEAFVKERAVYALDEAVSPRASHLGVAMLDVFERKQQLIRMRLGLAAELAAIVGEDRAHR